MTRETKSGGCHILQRQDDSREFRKEHFTPDYWQHKPGFQFTSGGRGGSCLIDIDGEHAILRQYHRGGFVGRLLHNQYMWLGKRMSRPWREWKVLQQARRVGLPVPDPIAACICRFGPWYHAALIIHYFEDTEMLTQRLAREPLSPQGWYEIGLLIKRMHSEGIRHADLTSDNVLIDSEDRFYIVDFDKARIMNRLDDWQWRPLLRFQRSILKRQRNSPLNFTMDDWQSMMDGYQS
ncbi:MAG: 3-deoxy-D-manno-octulosonic acid kinase [Gammaproteobacteria bacterium]|nr:MAG: 3-deoxy-D-manno-octulosonic acid kinase [Gammaproteobacteria bacterium]